VSVFRCLPGTLFSTILYFSSLFFHRTRSPSHKLSALTFSNQDPTKPGRFKFLEVWSEGRKWFEEVQMKKAYYVPYVEVTVPMYTEERKWPFLNS